MRKPSQWVTIILTRQNGEISKVKTLVAMITHGIDRWWFGAGGVLRQQRLNFPVDYATWSNMIAIVKWHGEEFQQIWQTFMNDLQNPRDLSIPIYTGLNERGKLAIGLINGNELTGKEINNGFEC